MMNRLTSPATIAMALLMVLPMACGDDGGGDGNPGDGDGGVVDGDGGNSMIDANPNAPRTVYRSSELVLLDPQIYASILGSPFDVTSNVNGLIEDGIENDEDEPPDNILDLNVSFVFQPLDQAAGSTPMTVSFADCSAPLATTACTQTATTMLVPATATNDASSTCLEAIAGTTTDGYAAVVPVPAPCFSSNELDVTVNLGTVTLPLKSARIAATYSGTPATSLVTGLLRGYVTKADAMNIIIPDGTPFVENMPLSDLLLDEDMDTDPDGTPMNGWWFYIAVEAGEVTYTVE
jgi:hypothetical protein